MHADLSFPDLSRLPRLSDEAAAQILEFLQQCVQQFESHYDGQLRRYYEDPTPDYQIDLFPESDPPF
jgi:hypothetical protein